MKNLFVWILCLFTFATMAQRRIGIQDYSTVAALQAETISPIANDKVYVKALQSVFAWDAASTATHDGVTVIKQTNITTGRFLLVGTSAYQLSGKLDATDTTTLLRKTTAAATYQPKGNYGLLGSNNVWSGNNTLSKAIFPQNGSWESYNTLDQTSNFERVRGYWNSDSYYLAAEKNAAGINRAIRISSNGAEFGIGGVNTSVFLNTSLSSATNSIGIFAPLLGTSSIQNSLIVAPTINQSSTAGYRGVFISPYEQSVGSGSRLLLDLGTNSAANGGGTHTSRAVINSIGFLGLGTTNPQSLIDAYNVSSASIKVRNDMTSAYLFASSTGLSGVGTENNTDFSLRTNGGEKGRIFANGNFFLGSSPVDDGNKLVVDGPARVSGNVIVTNLESSVDNTGSVGMPGKAFNAVRAIAVYTDNLRERGASGIAFTTNNNAYRAYMFSTTGNFHFQNGGTYSDIPSARVAVNSTTQGFLPPRMTAVQRNGIAAPVAGLVVYCTDCIRLDGGSGVLQTYNGTSWISAETATHAVTQAAGTNNTQIATTAFVSGAVTTLQNDVDTKTGLYTLTQIRAFAANQVTRNPRVYMTDSGKEGFWYYDNTDASSTDNTGTIVVTSSGARYKRVYDSAINTKWFTNTGDTHTGQAITRAINVAISNLSSKTNETVIINTGVNTVNSSPIYTPVPLNKKLTIKGEANNIIDFYCVECEGGVFLNSNTWTYTDSTYTHGTIEIDGLNFIGDRNPVSTYLSNNYGARPLLFRNMQRVEIRNCSFKNIYGTGLSVGVTASGIIENNLFYAVYARQPNALDATGDAIMLYAYCYDFLVKGNKIELRTGDYGRCGISVDDKSARCQVTGNLITGYERGIHVENCRNITISNNTIYRSPIAIMSAINKYVTWESNIIDGQSPVKIHELAYPGLVFFLNDTLSVFRGNTVRNWHGLANSYLAKFWGTDLLVENNIFEPNKNSAEIYGYYSNYRLIFRNNQIRGKANLVLDATTSSNVTGNDFYGGWLQGQNSIDLIAIGNKIKPDIGAALGNGFVLYGATRPYCSDNIFTNPISYCIENTNTTNGVYEANTYLRTQASAASYAYFFVSTSTPTGARKSSTARHNVVRDFINNETYYLGNATTASVY